MFEPIRRDLRLAGRSLLAARGFSLVVVATLALGVGATTAVFSVLHAAVLRPLPYPDAGRLARLYLTYRGEDNYLPGPAAAELRDRSATTDLALTYTYSVGGVDLTDRPHPERVITLPVAANYFSVLGRPLILGEPFAAAEERANARVAVVSARIWREYLGGGADAIGRQLSLNGEPHRIVGVMPDHFDDPLVSGVEIWLPLDMAAARADSWGNNYLSAIGRLRPGHSASEARAEFASLVAAEQTHFESSAARTAHLVPLQQDVVGGAARMLWLLQGAVAMLLLIACVNVASLLLARGAARQTELAVRRALGCPRRRLVSQFLVESLLLSLCGGAAGLLLALGTARALMASAPVSLPEAGGVVDLPVFAFCLAVACASGLAFGIAPALRFTRPDLESALREGGRGGTGSARETRVRGALVVCQVALALVLLIGAGLLLRTFATLQSRDLGIHPDGVEVFQVNLPEARYHDPLARARFHEELERRLEAIPGVTAAGAISRLPLTGPYHNWGARRVTGNTAPLPAGAQQRVIAGDYFKAMGIPILRGRGFLPSDDEKAPRRIVISRRLAEMAFPGEDPVGQQMNVAGWTLEIIGVAGDVPIAYRAPAPATIYHAHRQFASNRNWALTQVVSLGRPSPGFFDLARREVAAIDPSLVVYRPGSLRDAIGGGLAQERFALRLVGLFAVLAVLLAAIGLYGLLSYSVARRSREIGIRLALGAPAGSVQALVLREGGILAAAGVVCGLAAAALVTRWMGSLLFEVSPVDASIYTGAAIALVVVGLLASWMPARTAQRVNPLDALRAE